MKEEIGQRQRQRQRYNGDKKKRRGRLRVAKSTEKEFRIKQNGRSTMSLITYSLTLKIDL